MLTEEEKRIRFMAAYNNWITTQRDPKRTWRGLEDAWNAYCDARDLWVGLRI